MENPTRETDLYYITHEEVHACTLTPNLICILCNMCKTCKLANLIFAYVWRYMRGCTCYVKLIMQMIIIFRLKIPGRVLSILYIL